MTPDGPISGIRLSDAYLLDQRAVAVGEQLKAGGLLCHLQQGLFGIRGGLEYFVAHRASRVWEGGFL
jgi:hypothetical protein